MEDNVMLVCKSSTYPMDKNGYLLKEQIGEGMQSNKVWLAECIERGNEQVAIKQIDLRQHSHGEKEKISKEVQGMSRVASSQFVVQFHCSFIIEEQLWIVMELQEGSVRDVLKWKFRKGIDDEHVITSILYQTLQGINFLHGLGIIHRDIKAGNLLYNKEGNIKLADFGVSAILDDPHQKRTTMAGTYHWMAPEVIDPSMTEKGGYDYKADIWSFGITCIELAYGVPPYSDVKPVKVVVNIAQRIPLSLDKPSIKDHTVKRFSIDFKDFVDKCLQVVARNRPTAAKLLNHKLFNNVQSNQTKLKQALLSDLPSIGERYKRQLEEKRINLLNDLNNAGVGVGVGKPASGTGLMGLDSKNNSKGNTKKVVVNNNSGGSRSGSLSKPDPSGSDSKNVNK